VVILKVLLSRWFLEAEEDHENLESGKAMTRMKSKPTVSIICVHRITNA